MAGAVIKIGANTNDFQKQISEVNRQLKLTTSEFGVTAKQAELFGSTTDKLKAQQQDLTAKITAQNKIIDIYKNRISSLNGDINKQKTTQTELSKKIADTTKKYNESVKATGEDSKESKALKAELDKLAKQYNQNEKDIQKTNKKLDDSVIKMNNTKKSLLENKKALEDITEQLKKVKIEDFTKKLDTVAEKSDKIGSTLSKKVSAPIGALGTAMAVAAYSTENDLGKIQAKLGLTAQETEKVKKIAQTVYTDGYGESLGDVANGLSLIEQNFKTVQNWTDKSKINMTESIMAVGETFDVESQEIVRALKVIQNSGLEDDLGHSMDVITRGFQLGANYSDELLDSVMEYAPQFNKLGLSIDEAMNYLITGANNGAFSLDKVGDAMKEFAIRSIDGSASTQEGFKAIGLDAKKMAKEIGKGGDSAKKAFQKTLKGLANIKDPVKQEAAGVALFGTMWEDMGRDAMTSLANVEGGLTDTSEATDRMMEALNKSPAKEFTRTTREAKQALLPLGTELLKLAMTILPPVSDAIKSVTEWLNGLDEHTKRMIIGIGLAVIAIGPLVKGIGGAVKTVSGGIKFFSKTGELISKIPFDSIGKGFSTVGKVIASVGKRVLNVGKFFLDGFKIIGGGIGRLFSSITTGLSTAFNFIVGLNPAVLIIGGIILIITAIVLLWNNCEGFRNFVKNAWIDIQQSFQRFNEWLTGVFSVDWTEHFGVFGNVLNAFFANFSNIWEAVKKIFGGIVDFIAGVFTGDWERAWDGVVGIFGGIWSGIKAIVKAPLNGMISLVNAAIDGINSISVDIPDWVPKYGGRTVGFNLGHIDYLENGGILTKPTFAGGFLAGEKNKGRSSQAEAVIPLDTMYRKIDSIVAQYNQPTVAYITVINQMDGKEISKHTTTQVIKNINNKNRNHGVGRGRLA